MTPWESVRVAVRALQSNKLRGFLTMLGIVIGVSSVISMVAIGAGAQALVVEQIRSLGSNLLMVVPGTARDGGARQEAGSRHTLTQEDAAAIAELPAIVTASPGIRGTAQLVHGNRNWRTRVDGTTSDYFVARDWPLTAGRHFSPHEQLRATKVAVIGATVVEQLFAGDDPVGRSIRILNVPFRVIGVLAEKGTSPFGRDQDDVVLVPLSTATNRLIGSAHQVSRGAIHYVIVKVASEHLMPAAAEEIADLLRRRHRLAPSQDDDFRVNDPAATVLAQRAASRTVGILLAAVASVSLLVGGISIMNIMLVSVTERTREIGLRLAVGARRRDIRNQFLVEAVGLCVCGGVVGTILGIAAAIAMAKLSGWPIFLGPETIALAIGFTAAVGIFFGYYPASKAARLDPIEALRTE